TVQIILFSLFLSAMLLNMGLADNYIEYKLTPDEFTTLLTKIVGIYTVHLAVMFGCFFNSSVSGGNAEMTGHEKTSAIVIMILSISWNFMITITVLNYADKCIKEMPFPMFENRLESVTGAINFLIAGGLAYFFSIKTQNEAR